jgi:hypothetical protein
MKPGDLVRVTSPCTGDLKKYNAGEVGLIVGYSVTSTGVIRNDIFRVLFDKGADVFAYHLLEVIGESGDSCQ